METLPGEGALVGAVGGLPAAPTTLSTSELPLRILVPSDMIGAIIGRAGNTIRQITNDSKARIDVHRKDAAAEKIIAIYGRDANSTAIACRKILEVMKDEGEKLNKPEMCLKVLAHNNFIGRIIGKNGRVINDIKEKTNTRISVSSIYDMNTYSLDRTITVYGTIDEMSTAQIRIYEILRQSCEQDFTSPVGVSVGGMMTPTGGAAPLSGGHSSYGHPSAVQPMGFQSSTPGTPRSPYSVLGGSLPSPSPGGLPSSTPGAPSTPVAAPLLPSGSLHHTTQQPETTHLYIPASSVGAMIGKKGDHIRQVSRHSNASIKIASVSDTTSASSGSMEGAEGLLGLDRGGSERRVTIHGNFEAQCKALSQIFNKLFEEKFFGNDEPYLALEYPIPTYLVGKVLGRGKVKLKTVEARTGATLRCPDPKVTEGLEETPIQIRGTLQQIIQSMTLIRAGVQSAASLASATAPVGSATERAGTSTPRGFSTDRRASIGGLPPRSHQHSRAPSAGSLSLGRSPRGHHQNGT